MYASGLIVRSSRWTTRKIINSHVSEVGRLVREIEIKGKALLKLEQTSFCGGKQKGLVVNFPRKLAAIYSDVLLHTI